jgi:hypothetical protein
MSQKQFIPDGSCRRGRSKSEGKISFDSKRFEEGDHGEGGQEQQQQQFRQRRGSMAKVCLKYILFNTN